nr:MAG TPA: Transcriptional regulator, RHH-like, CopG [Caudoviricetes sp.]
MNTFQRIQYLANNKGMSIAEYFFLFWFRTGE